MILTIKQMSSHSQKLGIMYACAPHSAMAEPIGGDRMQVLTAYIIGHPIEIATQLNRETPLHPLNSFMPRFCVAQRSAFGVGFRKDGFNRKYNHSHHGRPRHPKASI